MRVTLTFIFGLIFGSVNAQELSVNFLESVEFVNPERSENYSLTMDSTQYFFTHYFDKDSMRDRCFMSTRSLRDNQISSGEINFRSGFSNVSNNAQNLSGTVALNGQIYAMVSTIRNEDGIRELTAHPVNSEMEIDREGKLVLEFPIEGLIRSGQVLSAGSSNGAYLAVLGIHPRKRKKDVLGELIIYDSEMYPIGKISINLGNTRWTKFFLHVSDQARAYVSTFKKEFNNETTLNVYEFDVNEPEMVSLTTVPLLENERISTYGFKVLPNGDFWVVGTLLDAEKFSAGIDPSEKLFIFRNTIAGDEMVINAIDNPTKDLRIRDIHVTDGNLVYICGEELTGNVESSIQFTYNMPPPFSVHGDEYVFGVDLDGAKLFEQRFEQYFEILNHLEVYTGGYELFGDSLIAIYHDESLFWGAPEENNQTIAVVTMIGPDGRVIRNIPFMNELTLPNPFKILPVLSEIDGSTITTFIRSDDSTQMIEINLEGQSD